MTRVHVIGWRTTYHGIMPAVYLDAIDQGEWL